MLYIQNSMLTKVKELDIIPYTNGFEGKLIYDAMQFLYYFNRMA